MSKLSIPTDNFDRELPPGSVPTAMKDASAVKGDIWMVPLGSIRRLADFNVRIKTMEYEQHKEEIAASIQANGFYANKPLAGYVAKEDDGNVIYLTDGYTRLDATELANERGAEIAALPVIVKPKGESLIDLNVALVQDNEGRPLGPFEKAIVVKRLLSYNVDKATIAARLSMTPRYVDDMEVLAGAPPKVRNLVIQGKVSPTEAVKQIRKNPGKAGDMLQKAVTTAEASGKKKATGRHIAAAEADDKAKDGSEATSDPVRETATKKGKIVDKLTFRLKSGDKVSAESLTPIFYADEGKWRREPTELDSNCKEGDWIITEDVTITLIVERVARTDTPADDEKPAADENGGL